MRDFAAVGHSPLSPMMPEVLKAHGIDATESPTSMLRLANARCLTCEHADVCFAWLTGTPGAEDYHWFCPNAQLFDGLPKAPAH